MLGVEITIDTKTKTITNSKIVEDALTAEESSRQIVNYTYDKVDALLFNTDETPTAKHKSNLALLKETVKAVTENDIEAGRHTGFIDMMTDASNTGNTAKDLVSYSMQMMNREMAKNIVQAGRAENAFFRTIHFDTDKLPDALVTKLKNATDTTQKLEIRKIMEDTQKTKDSKRISDFFKAQVVDIVQGNQALTAQERQNVTNGGEQGYARASSPMRRLDDLFNQAVAMMICRKNEHAQPFLQALDDVPDLQKMSDRARKVTPTVATLSSNGISSKNASFVFLNASNDPIKCVLRPDPSTNNSNAPIVVYLERRKNRAFLAKMIMRILGRKATSSTAMDLNTLLQEKSLDLEIPTINSNRIEETQYKGQLQIQLPKGIYITINSKRYRTAADTAPATTDSKDINTIKGVPYALPSALKKDEPLTFSIQANGPSWKIMRQCCIL